MPLTARVQVLIRVNLIEAEVLLLIRRQSLFLLTILPYLTPEREKIFVSETGIFGTPKIINLRQKVPGP